MAHVIVLGAGLGGIPMAYELKEELHKVRSGTAEPFYEKYVFRALGIGKLKHRPEDGALT